MGELAFRTEDHEIRGEVEAFTLRIAGTVSRAEAPVLRTRILDVLQKKPEERIVLSLGNIDSMDTAGAAVLVEAVLAGQRAGKRVLLCSSSASVMRMFEMAGVEDAIEACCPTPDVTWQRLQN